jgi:hypothetical protein
MIKKDGSVVNYLIGYIYPDDILLVGTVRLSKYI